MLKGFVIGGTQANLICIPLIATLFALIGEAIIAALCIPIWFLMLYMNTEAKKWK